MKITTQQRHEMFVKFMALSRGSYNAEKNTFTLTPIEDKYTKIWNDVANKLKEEAEEPIDFTQNNEVVISKKSISLYGFLSEYRRARTNNQTDHHHIKEVEKERNLLAIEAKKKNTQNDLNSIASFDEKIKNYKINEMKFNNNPDYISVGDWRFELGYEPEQRIDAIILSNKKEAKLLKILPNSGWAEIIENKGIDNPDLKEGKFAGVEQFDFLSNNAQRLLKGLFEEIDYGDCFRENRFYHKLKRGCCLADFYIDESGNIYDRHAYYYDHGPTEFNEPLTDETDFKEENQQFSISQKDASNVNITINAMKNRGR